MTKDCWDKFVNFKPSEFKCGCGCETEHINMNCNLVHALQTIRIHYNAPVNILSGFRCEKYNSSLTGSIKNSDHLHGDAADIQVQGKTSVAYKKSIIEYASKLPGFIYGYYNGGIYKNGKWTKYTAPNMGRSIHLSFK